jgi:uncharacterized membrane protein
MKKVDLVLLILIIVGVADSVYLLLAEMSAVPLYCGTKGAIDCSSVLLSKYAFVFGIPLVYYVVFWFVVSLVLIIATHKHKKIEGFRDFWLAVGIGGAVYSLAAMYVLGTLCEYCLILDGILIIIFAITVDKYR